MKLATVIRGAEAIQADTSLTGLLKYSAKLTLRITEKITGLHLYTNIENLPFDSPNPTALSAPLQIIVKLHKYGLLEKIEKLPREYPDEVKVHSFRIVGTDTLWGSGHGVDFDDEQKALWRTVGEYAERLLWRHYIFYQKTFQGSQKSLPRTMALGTLAGFSNPLIKNNSILQFDEQTTFTWTPVTSLTSNQKILCPVQLLSNFYTRNHVKSLLYDEQENATREPMLRWCVTTGLATGTNINDALVSGMLEVIERDAFMLMYLNKIVPKQVDTAWLASQNPEISNILEKLANKNITVHILLTPTDFPVHVITIVLKDTSLVGPAISVAASAGFDLVQTITEALSEAVAVRLFLRRALENGISFDSHNIDQEGRLLYWAQHSNTHKLDYLLTGAVVQPADQDDIAPQTVRLSYSQNVARYTKEQYKSLINEFKDQKQTVVYADLTSPEIRKVGLRVIKIVAPAMHPLHLHERLPYHYSERLTSVPTKLGLQVPSSINLEPHPFP